MTDALTMYQTRYRIKSYCADGWGVGEEGSEAALKHGQTTSLVSKTFINPEEQLQGMPLPLLYWWSYKSNGEWRTWSKKPPWQQLSSSACNSCKPTRRHTIFQSGKRCRLSTLSPTEWFTSREFTRILWLSKYIWTMGWRGQAALGTEAICWCIDLRMALDVLTIQPCWSLCDLLCSKHFLSAHCCCVNLNLWLWIQAANSHVASCLRCVPQSACTWYSSFKRWHVLPHPTGDQQPCLYGNIPSCTTVVVSQPAFLSIRRTIEIVIDLPCLDPVAIRSHSESLSYWKSKHSWCYRLKCSMPGCSVGAMCLL